ncbi:DUF397 domain-containing protein [Streptomyces europaeiscabiei]|uniref:DUF397 domain-containing protein n=2 Tax=Streptomyces europaeiscabiei TaxID=146819 RepID=UPI00099E999F|nr:DUF397 domain-containing protein [Streptomyces europaeiscabiei]MDX3669158.1 DUF397 domain-containing protein [Streptomyces europaeiscabiei]
MPTSQFIPEHAWFKSSYSGANTTECLEAAFVPAGVLIRDSKRPEGPHVAVAAAAWGRFVAASVEPAA